MRSCDIVLRTQALPAMQQKEQEEPAKLFLGEVLDCRPALTMSTHTSQYCEGKAARSAAACQHTLLALGLGCRQPCLLAHRPASPPAQSAHPLTHVCVGMAWQGLPAGRTPFACDRWHVVSTSSRPSLFSAPGTLSPTFIAATLIDLKPSGTALTCPVLNGLSCP